MKSQKSLWNHGEVYYWIGSSLEQASTVKLGFIYTAIHSIKLLRGTLHEVVAGREILDSFSMEEHLFSPYPAPAAPDDDSL